MTAGLLGGAGQGISKNAETQMEQWKQKAEEMRQMSLMKLQQDYSTGERIAGQQFTAGENKLNRQARVDERLAGQDFTSKEDERKIQARADAAEAAAGYQQDLEGIRNENKLEQIKTANAGALAVDNSKSKIKGANATKLKMANKYIDDNIKINFITKANSTPGKNQNIDQFYVTNSITGARELDVNKIVASLPFEKQQQIKDTRLMTETLISNYKYEPQEAVDFAERKVASDIVKKNQAKVEKEYGMSAKDINDIFKMKPTQENINRILDNPDKKMREKSLYVIQQNLPSFYNLLLKEQEKRKNDTKYGNVDISLNASSGDLPNSKNDVFTGGNVSMVDPSTSVNLRGAPPQNGGSIFTNPLPKSPPYKQNTQGILDGSVMSRY